MLDDSGTFTGGAAKEIEEETGLKIPAEDLINLTELALPKPSSDNEEHLQQSVYPSPGGCDEFVPLFLYQKRIPREQLKEWSGKLTGLREHGEKITLEALSIGKGVERWRQRCKGSGCMGTIRGVEKRREDLRCRLSMLLYQWAG